MKDNSYVDISGEMEGSVDPSQYEEKNMSADNYMAVRMLNGKWHAWMVLGGYEPEDWLTPGGSYHKEFDDPMSAITYAANVCQDEVVEYGIEYFPEDLDE
jgi:hypothetical protein